MRRSILSASLTCFFFAWTVIFPSVVRADTPAVDPSLDNAKQHFEAGRAAYNTGDYTTSIREFKAAEALRPSPILSYNIGLANEKLGRRRVALQYYKRYLDGSPQAPNRAEVEGRIATLQQSLQGQPDPAQGQQPQEPTASMQDDPPPPPPGDPNAPPPQVNAPDPYQPQAPIMTQKPRKSRWWVGLVIGLSVAVVVTAIVVPTAIIYTRHHDTVVYDDAKAPLPRGLSLERASLTAPSTAAQTGKMLELHF